MYFTIKKEAFVDITFPNDISESVSHLNALFNILKKKKSYLLEGSSYRVNFISSKRCVKILAPSTCECNLIWR